MAKENKFYTATKEINGITYTAPVSYTHLDVYKRQGLTLKDTLEKHRKDIIYAIKRDIGVGLSNGDRYTTMARRISKNLDGDYKKSIRIVRTEAHRVSCLLYTSL